MPINSRQKGAVGEREWAAFLSDKGYPARRGQQFSGGTDSPDVVCETLGEIHWEVKRVQNLQVHKAIQQAIRDAGSKIPVLAHRRNGEPWLVTIPAEAFFEHFIGAWSLCSMDPNE